MRTASVEIFDVNELSPSARERAYHDWLNSDDYAWGQENSETLKEFEKIFPVKVTDSRYDAYTYWYALDWEGDDEVAELSGIRLMKYIWNNYRYQLWKGRWYSTPGKRDEQGKYTYKERDSKIILNHSCVLTGYCMDDDILYPIHQFLADPKESTTFVELMRDCLDSFFKACVDDYAACQSMEYFINMSEGNDWEYTEEGKLWRNR